MTMSSIVGSRELKTRLGQYLNRVRGGETILVTDRNEPVAELRPLSGDADSLSAALRKLVARHGDAANATGGVALYAHPVARWLGVGRSIRGPR